MRNNKKKYEEIWKSTKKYVEIQKIKRNKERKKYKKYMEENLIKIRTNYTYNMTKYEEIQKNTKKYEEMRRKK